MSGSARHISASQSFSGYKSSDADSKKPVKFQIQTSKRLTLVQYSDDDSSESTAETTRSHVQKANKLESQSSKVKSASDMSENEAFSSKKSTNSLHQGVHVQATAERLNVNVKSSESNVLECSSVKYHSAEQKSRFEDPSPTWRSTDKRQFSSRHKSSYDRSRNDRDTSPKTCDADENVFKHTSSSSRSKEASVPISQNCSDKGQPSSKRSPSELKLSRDRKRSPSDHKRSRDRKRSSERKRSPSDRFSEVSDNVGRKSLERRSERHETRVEKSKHDVSMTRNIHDRNELSECSLSKNKSTIERPQKYSEIEKQLHKTTDKHTKYVKPESQIVYDKKQSAQSSHSLQESSQSSEDKKNRKEFRYNDTSDTHKHDTNRSGHHSYRESQTPCEKVVERNKSRDRSNLADISYVRETDSKIHQGASIPKMISCNSLDNIQNGQCETLHNTSMQYRYEKDVQVEEYEKPKISLDTSDCLSSKKSKSTARRSDKFEIREVSSSVDEKSSYLKSNRSSQEIDARKVSSNKPKSGRSRISAENKSDELKILPANWSENKSTVTQDSKSLKPQSKKVSSKLRRKSSSESVEDSSTSSSDYSSSDEAGSSSSSSSSSTSSNDRVVKGNKKGKSRHSKEIIKWVEVTKPVIERVSAQKKDNKEICPTADCQKKTNLSDSLANQTELDNIVSNEHLLADDKPKYSAIKFSGDKQFVSEDSVRSNSAINTSIEGLPLKDMTGYDSNKELQKGKISVEIYSPSAPTGWDADEKPGNAYGWSSDSDIENSVLELSPVQRPPCLTALQDEKLAKLMVNSSSTQSLDSAHLEVLKRSLVEGGLRRTEISRTIGSGTTGDALCPQLTDKKDPIEVLHVKKTQTNLKFQPKSCVEHNEKGKQENSDVVKAMETSSVTTSLEDINSSLNKISEASCVGSMEEVTATARLQKKQENIGSLASSRRVHQSNSPTSRSSSLVQSYRIAKNDSSANQSKPTISSESDHNRRRRRDYSSFSVAQERTKQLHSSPRSRSPSYERDRKRKRSPRRSRSKDRFYQRREPMLSSRSSSGREVSNHFNRSKDRRANSHSSDSDDVVILEDYDLISEKRSGCELIENSSTVCKSNSDAISPGNLDLNTIPLPGLENIPLPVLPDSMLFPSVQEPVQANNPSALKACISDSLSLCATSESVDRMENVDMDLDNSHDSGVLRGMQTDDMDLDNSLTDVDIIMECDQSSKTGQRVLPSIRKQPPGDDVAASTTTEFYGADQTISIIKHTEAVQSQVADISSTTVESPRSADEVLPSSQSLKYAPGKIVLSLNDQNKTKEESPSASTLWKRKLASNLLKPIKFNIPAAITIGQTPLSDDDYQSDRSPEVTSIRESISVSKSSDICHTTKEKKRNVDLSVEQPALSDAPQLAVMSSKCERPKVVAHHSDMVRSPDTVLKNIQDISSSATNADEAPNLAPQTNVHPSDSSEKRMNVGDNVCGLPIVVVGRVQPCEIEKREVSLKSSYSPGKIEIISSSQNTEKSHMQSLSDSHSVPPLNAYQMRSQHSTTERTGDLLLHSSDSTEQRKSAFDEKCRSANISSGASDGKAIRTLQKDSVVSYTKSGEESHKQKQHSSSQAAKDSNVLMDKLDSIKRSITPDSCRRRASSSRRRHSRSPSRTSRDRSEHCSSSSKHKFSESSHSKRHFHERRSRSRSRSESRQKRKRRSSSSGRSPSYHRQSNSTTNRINVSKHRRSRSSSRKKDDKESPMKSNRRNRSASVENGIKLKIDRSYPSTERCKESSLECKQSKSGDQKDVRRLESERKLSPLRSQDDSRNKSLRREDDDHRHTFKGHISPDRKRSTDQLSIPMIEVDETCEKLRLASPAAFMTSGKGRIDKTSLNDLNEYKKLHSYSRRKDEQFVDDLDKRKDEMLHDIKQRSTSSSLKSSSHDSFAMPKTGKVDTVNIDRTSTNNDIVRKASRWERLPTTDMQPVAPHMKDNNLLSASHFSDQQSQSGLCSNHRTSPKSKWSPSKSRFGSTRFEKDYSGASDKSKNSEEQREVYGVSRSSDLDRRIPTSSEKRSCRSSSRERPKMSLRRSRSGSRPRESRERSYSRELKAERSAERLLDQQRSLYSSDSSRLAQREVKSRDGRACEDLHKLDRSTYYTTERDLQKKLQLGAQDGQSLNTNDEQLSPLNQRHHNTRGRSPGSLKTSVELHHSVVIHENKSSDYYGRRKSPVMQDSVSRNEKPNSSTSSLSVMRRMHSGKDRSPEYSSSSVLTSSAKQQSYSRENRSPDYRSRFKSPVKHHSESRGSKSQDYFEGTSRSSSLKHRASPNRDKSPARQRHYSLLSHGDKPDDYSTRPRSPVRRSPARHQPLSRRDDFADASRRSLSPMAQRSRSHRDTFPDTRSISPSRHHRRQVQEETLPSTIGRLSPMRYHSGSGEKKLQGRGDSRSQRLLLSGCNDVVRSPNRHLSYSPGRRRDVASPVHYDECPVVSPSMSITSLPDQDIIVNEASDKPMERCFNSGQIETVLYSETGAPQNPGVYAPPMPYASFPLGTNHPSYQCIAAPSTGTTGWYQLPVAPAPAALPLPGNFNSFGGAWNEPFNSGVVVMPGGPQVQPGVFNQPQTHHPSNSYITPGASQFLTTTVNQGLQPVVGHNINADVWLPQTAHNTFQLSKSSYEELPDSSGKLTIQQSCPSFGESNLIPVVGSSVAVESQVKKVPSPQWKPLPDRFRDKFRPSFEDRSSRKPQFEAGVADRITTRLTEGATDCTTPNIGAQLNRQLAETEDPRCCCLWEAIPEVLEGMEMTADIASQFGDGQVTQKAKKRPGRHFEDDTGVVTIRRRSSRFKPADEVSSNDSEKPSEVKTENEPVSSQSQQSITSDDGSEISKQLTGNSTSASNDVLLKPEKVKSRWRRWSELETDSIAPPPPPPPTAVLSEDVINEEDAKLVDDKLDIVEEKRPYFEEILDNIFLSSRDMKKSRKEARNMICDCTPPSAEELARGVLGCSDDCLNRMLMIECGSRCPCGDLCTNKLFQRHQYSDVKCFKTDYKGWGLQADEDLPPGSFIMEYVGEVLDPREFKSRIKKYARENYEHHYFMALNADEVIDATKKGNVSRFVNHCCDPNSETQKWTVNGQLRIGFFTIKPVKAGEELTFDYQFETYGQEATKCYCGASNCRGTIDVGRRSPSKKRGVKLAAKIKEIKRMPGMFSDIFLEEEIEKMSSMGGLRRKDDVLELNRLMLRAESFEHRAALLKALQDTKEPACLRLFLDYHGLALLWSWMVDVIANDFSFKTQVLKTLKLLPIGNKTILRDSRIMAVIEKWANQLTVDKTLATDLKVAAISRTKTGDSISDSDAQLSQVSESSSTVCTGAGSERLEMSEYSSEIKDVKESIVADGSMAGTKCQVLSAAEAASSCNEEHVKTEDCGNNQAEGDTSVSILVDNSGISASRDEDNTPATEEDTLDRQAVSAVTDLATHLLSEWASLKEAYKIPKLSVQERKKTEQELDRQCEENLGRKDPLSSWSRAINRRQAEDSPDLKRRRRDDRGGRLSEADDLKTSRIRNLRPIVSTPPSAKSVLSTPPLLSKEERRQQFEAQVRAHDELRQQKVDFEQQQLQHQQPDSTYTDLFATPSASTSFDYPEVTQYSLDTQVDRYHVDASTSLVPGTYGSDLIMPLQRQLAVASYGSDTALSGPLISGTYSSNVALSAQVGVGDQTSISYGSLSDQAFFGTQPVLQASYQQLTQPTERGQIHQTSHSYPQPPVVSNDSYSLLIDPLGQGQQYSTQGGVYYAVQGTTLLVQQPVYTPSTQQIVHVANSRTSNVVSRDPRDPPPPPPSPPKHKALRLPPNWKTAKDLDGKLYYYHSVTRQTQWDPPAWDAVSVEDEEEEIIDFGTPTLEESRMSGHRRHTTTTAAADTSSEVAKRLRDQFRSQIAKHIVACLGPYRRPDCEQGRINTTEEFKLLARKLSYAVLTKELKHCRHLEDLEVNENVKGKAKNFVLKYMSRFPGMYRASNNSP